MARQSYRTQIPLTGTCAGQSPVTSASVAFAAAPSSARSCTWADLASNPVFAGFLLSISNPYWTIWWATIGVGYIALSLPFGKWGLTSFYCGHILADLSWYSFISGSIALGKKSFSPRLYHFIILLCGIFLIIFGIYFSYSGFHFLFQ
jgi:threonine/homoserine/homoserine lactone efflux protein